MEAELAQQNKIQASIRQETYLLKKSANELKDQIANLSISLRELQASERQLSKEIVHSPDRIKIDLADAIQRLERMKKSIGERQHERSLVQRQLQHTSSAEESVRHVIMNDLREMESKVKAYKLAMKELGDVTKKLKDMEQDVEEKKKVKEMQRKELEAVGMLELCSFAVFANVVVHMPNNSSSSFSYTHSQLSLSLSISPKKNKMPTLPPHVPKHSNRHKPSLTWPHPN